jgi:hypothetical protein
MSRWRFLGLFVLAVLTGAFVSEFFDDARVGVVLVFGAVIVVIVAVMRGFGRTG